MGMHYAPYVSVFMCISMCVRKREREREDGTCWAITVFAEWNEGVEMNDTVKWNTVKLSKQVSLQTKNHHLQIVYPLTKINI